MRGNHFRIEVTIRTLLDDACATDIMSQERKNLARLPTQRRFHMPDRVPDAETSNLPIKDAALFEHLTNAFTVRHSLQNLACV